MSVFVVMLALLLGIVALFWFDAFGRGAAFITGSIPSFNAIAFGIFGTGD